MDGSTLDHSDSDSGDSWTILEHSPVYGDDAPGFVENTPVLDRETADSNIDKDEDTDGISIISDSEPESCTPYELDQDKCVIEESRPAELSSPQYISFSPLPPNSHDHAESARSEDDFIGDNTGKHKTYVHRRNKRLSTVLNIIMLGSVITAAGVAIGHMWGARNECFMHTAPSINKILSNLYKLQEENTYLRNKLKELTAVNTHIQRKANSADKVPFKQLRCKKVYEEPLNSKNRQKITKCLDAEPNSVDKNLNSHLIQPQYEQEFARDVEKLKHIYQQNKSWLDEEITRRIKHEDQVIKAVKSPLTSITEEQKILRDENVRLVTDSDSNQSEINISPDAKRLIEIELDAKTNDNDKPHLTLKKITYADSLKFDHPQKVQKREINRIEEKNRRDKMKKKQIKKDKDVVTFLDINFSDEELKKDDRYIGPKPKQERKKRDRQKLHKKQKRRNKYEQWEMKGGYMKDYDDFSSTSFLGNNFAIKKPDVNQLSGQFEKVHYINKFPEADSTQNVNVNTKPKEVQNKKVEKSNCKTLGEDVNWFDKRAALRTEARKRLEHELFGETSPNNAGWYFRRMQKREQCRAKSDNSTYKKLSKM